MQAALAEQIPTDQDQPIAVLLEDAPAVIEAERFIRGIGGTALVGVEMTLSRDGVEVKTTANLAEAIDRAEHDPAAYQLVRANVRTEGFEQTLKSGNVTEIDLLTDDDDVIYQHNQTLRTVHGNALIFASEDPKMRARSIAETTNGFRLQRSKRRGELKDHSFAVFSLVADDMTPSELIDANFYTDTMSLVIQVITEKDGQLKMESAFVAGVKKPGGDRHDISAIKLLAKKLGLDFDGLTVTEILASPALIDNVHLPNGVIDLVELLDVCIDEVTGADDTFFGQAKGKQNYLEFREYCRERAAEFEPKVEAATWEVVTSARGSTPIEAVERLHKITEKHMVELAVFNPKIDPWVFGPRAAGHIFMARWHLEQGNIAQAVEETLRGQQKADSKSCPANLRKSKDSDKEGAESESSSATETCEFESVMCPLCKAEKVKTRVSKIEIAGQKYTLVRGIDCGCYKMAPVKE